MDAEIAMLASEAGQGVAGQARDDAGVAHGAGAAGVGSGGWRFNRNSYLVSAGPLFDDVTNTISGKDMKAWLR